MTAITPLPADESFDSHVPRPTAGSLIREYGPEAVGWSPASESPIFLEPVTTLVWQLLDGTASAGEIVEDVHAVLGVPPAIARDQLRRSLLNLRMGGLVDAPPVDHVPPDEPFFSHPPNP